MPTTATAELYFIAGAFVLILLICTVSVFVFFRQLKREKGQGDVRSEIGTAGRETESGLEEE